MKILVIILKVLILIATGVIAIVFNVFGAISMLSQGLAEDMKIVPQVVFWLIISIVCYIAPTFLIMLKEYKISAGISLVGFVCVLVLHELFSNGKTSGIGKELYLPLLLITILVVLLAIFANWDNIHGKLDDRQAKKTAVAPSILGGTTGGNTSNGKKSQKGSNKKR